jgi:hypothetical protein
MRRLTALCVSTVGLIGCGKKEESSLQPVVANPAAPLIVRLKEDSKADRIAAIQALGAMGEQAKSAVPELERLANDSDEKTRREAAKALQAIAPESAEGRSATALLRVKEIGQGMLNYVEANNGAFPQTCTIVTPKDASQLSRPGLSWRVLLLPYLGEKELFARFKLDQPWDSEHNKKLIEKMPAVYAPPAGSPGETRIGETHLQVFTYATTLGFALGSSPFNHPAAIAFQKLPPCPIQAITDGTSNTFLVVEAAKPVIWTRPDDVVVSDAPLPELGHAVDDIFHVCMADGAVYKLSRRSSAFELRTAIGRADGFLLDLDRMTPAHAPPPPKETTPVLGRVVMKGVPLSTGWVVLHSDDGREYGGQIGVAGSFLVKGVPVGKVKATIALGDPFAEWMADPNAKIPFGARPLVSDIYQYKHSSPWLIEVKAVAKEINLTIE